MNKTIQTKRNKPASGKYRVLYAKTGRTRRYKAATATMDSSPADSESDVPGVGIGRALLVILILHVVAIAAIYAHSKWSKETETVAQPSNPTTPVVATPKEPAPQPPREPRTPRATPAAAPVLAAPAAREQETVRPAQNVRRHWVMTGETYSAIARQCNVDERALRALNDGRPLRAGVVLDLPEPLSDRPVDPSPAPSAESQPVAEAPKAQPAEPAEQHPRAIVVEEAPKPAPVVVKPKVTRPVEQPEVAGLKDSGKRHVVKKGDSIWRIAKRYGVSRDALMEINGMNDPRKLRLDSTIKIPAK